MVTYVSLDELEEGARIFRTRDFRVDAYPSMVNPNHVPADFLAEREARVEAHRRRVEGELSTMGSS
jgi:hypothetical protein